MRVAVRDDGLFAGNAQAAQGMGVDRVCVQAERLLGHSAGYFVGHALIWTAAIVAVALPLAGARYRRG